MKFYVNGNVIICQDWMDWDQDELSKWCQQHECQLQGQTVVVPDEKRLTLFCLTYS